MVSQFPKTPQGKLEAISLYTWNLLGDAKRLGASIYEETVTDLLSIDVMRNKGQVKVTQTTKIQESKSGTDIELWLKHHAGNDGWIRFAIQAKKLNILYERYGKLKSYKPKNQPYRQVLALETYVKNKKAIPLYLLYNYTGNIQPTSWHCCRSFEPHQLGCTVAITATIHQAIKTSQNNFNDLHRFPTTMPLRCLACPIFYTAQNVNPEDYAHADLPNFMHNENEIHNHESSTDLIDPYGYDNETGPPRRIWAIDASSDEEEINNRR